MKAYFPTAILGSPLCPAELVNNLDMLFLIHLFPNIFRMSAKVVLCNSVTLDMSDGFLLMMLLYLWPKLLLVVGWITVTHFSGFSLSPIYVNYSGSKIVQLELYQIPVDTLV